MILFENIFSEIISENFYVKILYLIMWKVVHKKSKSFLSKYHGFVKTNAIFIRLALFWLEGFLPPMVFC